LCGFAYDDVYHDDKFISCLDEHLHVYIYLYMNYDEQSVPLVEHLCIYLFVYEHAVSSSDFMTYVMQQVIEELMFSTILNMSTVCG